MDFQDFTIIDKSWIGLPRDHDAFKVGVRNFIDYASWDLEPDQKIFCPCKDCNNNKRELVSVVHGHILWNGFMPGYVDWVYHGEGEDQVRETTNTGNVVQDDDEEMSDLLQEMNYDASNFYKLLNDAQVSLYPGCEKFSRLSFIVHLLHVKSLGGLNIKGFDALLSLLTKAFPDAKLPKNFYDARTTIKGLGLGYILIDACENDCVLFWKENADKTSCPVCHASRWKTTELNVDNESIRRTPRGKNIPVKQLRYFPLKPRLQRLFMSSKTASYMRYHAKRRPKDGVLRHPVDAETWKTFDKKHPEFAADPRNVRLALATDGMNPFGNMLHPHSTWPVVLINYNLPPWLCMKEENFILSMIIPGPKSPGNDIDVYLQPLIEELKELWDEGVETYDISKKENFKCRAALLGTISDFPALAMLSGWSTKGEFACPCCGPDRCSERLSNGGKYCYMHHRRYLPAGHHWRHQKSAFDGEKELREPPHLMNGDEIAQQLAHFRQVQFGKNAKQTGLTEITLVTFEHNWKKKSIFHELPYLSSIICFHNVDVMHVEKNICETVLGTVMNVEGKTKDNLKARLDLMDWGLRPELHLRQEGDKIVVPTASFVMSPKEKESFCRTLKDIKVPDGYSSNISRCVNVKDRKIMGLKSHDYHVLMEYLFPIALRGHLDGDILEALSELCMFFKVLCTRVLKIEDLDKLQDSIAITLCKLERIFPPSFFVVMMHLPIHLTQQAKDAGPVQYRWMYPIESLTVITLGICCCTKFNKLERNEDDEAPQPDDRLIVFKQSGRPVGAETWGQLTESEMKQIQLYALLNTKEVQPYEEEHKSELQSRGLRDADVNRRHIKEFPDWFATKIYQLHKKGQVSDELYSLSQGPAKECLSYNGYIINGFRFHTREWESRRKSQNSGLCVPREDEGVAEDENDFYGVVNNIIEARYVGQLRVLLFKCDWRPIAGTDEFGFTSVHMNRRYYVNEPFILASQAQQVFYINDVYNKQNEVVIKTQPRRSFNIPEIDSDGETETESSTSSEAYQEWHSSYSIKDLRGEPHQDRSDSFVWDRNDVPPETISRAAAAVACRSQEDEEENDTDAVYTSDDEDEYEFDDNNNRDDMEF
ncbi:uncharacterized protein LOC113291866 [Papaver somniferum]|uniref:uncharacterized protein LOC113291866 n=1 Tax=Papaver somniferum TaxID=3469 RepID=UPI000E6FA425|nr:uncharacterized protein LOC113291866 [Papaver somniferum]